MQRDYCRRRYRADFIGFQTSTNSVDGMGILRDLATLSRVEFNCSQNSFRFLAGRLPVSQRRNREREIRMLRKKGRLALALTAAADGDKGVTAVKQTAVCQPKEKKDDEASGHRRGRERSPRPWRGRRPNWTAQPLEMRVVAVGNHATLLRIR